jgi:hypothetical protein
MSKMSVGQSKLVGVDIHIDFEVGRGRRDAIYRRIRSAILDGRIRGGDALPPTRELARRLAVSRNTVSATYDRLTAEGFRTVASCVCGACHSVLFWSWHAGGTQVPVSIMRSIGWGCGGRWGGDPGVSVRARPDAWAGCGVAVALWWAAVCVQLGAWPLAQANLGQRQAETSYGIPVDEVTPVVPWSAYSLRKLWNQAKDEIAPWWGENSKEAYASGVANLATALGNWNASRTGTRRGRKVRFPRFKGKRHGMSCRFTTGAFGLAEGDRRHVKLPRIGLVRTHESTRKLARHIERGTARIRSATVTHQGGRWFCSFSVEIERHDRSPARIARLHTAVANARRDGLH